MATWFLPAVNSQAQEALQLLREVPGIDDFYLAGGTALALQTGHRISVDLDFFSNKNILGLKELDKLKNSLRSKENFKIRQEEEGTLHIVFEKTMVSFLRYSYSLIRPPRRWKGIEIAGIEDIALMKMGAVIGRGAKKDFLDLYVACQRYSLGELFKLAEKKFPDASDFPLQACRALVYFDDAEKDSMPKLLKPLNWDQVKTYFEKETRKTLKMYLR